MAEKTDITPETKIGALLDAYPGLEEVLIAQAPIFKNLKNPVLRKTVAKVATVERAAQMAGLKPRDLVNTLRVAAGLSALEDGARGDKGIPETMELEPPWVETFQLQETIDADAILAAGQAPLPGVMRHANALEGDTMFRIVSSFRPTPLIDTLRDKGYKTYTRALGAEKFETFVSR